MILGYKQTFPFNGELTNFHKKIIAGRYSNSIYASEGWTPKVHSIREDTFNRWKPGMLIQHAYGVRTKNYDCFDECQCVSTQKIEIKEYFINEDGYLSNSYTFFEKGVPRIFRIYVDDRLLDDCEIEILANNDGFQFTRDFLKWFNKPFTGKIIHWTDLKY